MLSWRWLIKCVHRRAVPRLGRRRSELQLISSNFFISILQLLIIITSHFIFNSWSLERLEFRIRKDVSLLLLVCFGRAAAEKAGAR